MDINLTVMQSLALAIAGMCHALIGSVKVPLAKQLDIPESRVGQLVSVFGFTLIPMAFAAGYFADNVGRNPVVEAGFVLVIFSVVVLATLKSYKMALVSILLLGTGWSALVNVLNALQGPAFLSAEEASSDRLPFAMNLGDFIFGMGAFVMPIVVTFMIRKVGLRKTFFSFALLVAVPLVLCFSIDLDQYVNDFGALKEANDSEMVSAVEEVEEVIPEVTEYSDQPELGFADLMGDEIVMLCCLAFFFHVPVEACVGAWATTLSMDRGTSEGKATGLLSVFWLTFTVSRLIAALVLPHGSHEVAVIGFAVVMLLVVYGLIKSQKAEGTNALLILAGLILGPIFPILIALLVGHVDVALQGRAIGLFFCIGGIGWALIPYLVGRQADKSGLQKRLYIVAASAAGLIISTIVLVSQLGA
ncbi:MAG: MFS transporter [Pirellulales bacterium]|nr:MFS transporter [Pirellulales bacterium]